MTKFLIPVIFSKTGTYEIEAKNLGEAIQKIYNSDVGFPEEDEYLLDSLQLDYNLLEEDYPSFGDLPNYFIITKNSEKKSHHFERIDKWDLLKKLSSIVDDPIFIMENLTKKGIKFDEFSIAKLNK